MSGVACDSQDRVYVFIRLPQPEVMVFDPDGRLRDRWGRDLFTKPHGIWISPDDHVYLTDTANHTVIKTTLDGKVVMTSKRETTGTPKTIRLSADRNEINADGEDIAVVRRHPTYEKVVRRSGKLHAHDEENQAKEGDVVRVVEARPLSRTKRWRLLEVIERAR